MSIELYSMIYNAITKFIDLCRHLENSAFTLHSNPSAHTARLLLVTWSVFRLFV